MLVLLVHVLVQVLLWFPGARSVPPPVTTNAAGLGVRTSLLLCRAVTVSQRTLVIYCGARSSKSSFCVRVGERRGGVFEEGRKAKYKLLKAKYRLPSRCAHVYSFFTNAAMHHPQCTTHTYEG